MRVLMVCLGNICRSPVAEGVLQHKAKEAGLEMEVDSAGTNGYHIGEPPHPSSIKVARLHGIDISGQRARQFAAEDVDRFDLIYALASDVMEDIDDILRRKRKDKPYRAKIALLMDEVSPGAGRSVKDPYYGPESGYVEMYGDIETACDAIVKRLAAHS